MRKAVASSEAWRRNEAIAEPVVARPPLVGGCAQLFAGLERGRKETGNHRRTGSGDLQGGIESI